MWDVILLIPDHFRSIFFSYSCYLFLSLNVDLFRSFRQRLHYLGSLGCSPEFSPELLFIWRSLVMSMTVSFMLSFFPRDVLDEILNLIE